VPAISAHLDLCGIGYCVARDFSGEDYHRGCRNWRRGILPAGWPIEGLNQTGHIGTSSVVILNDNGMSISPTVAPFARLRKSVSDPSLPVSKEKVRKLLTVLPLGIWCGGLGLQIESWLKKMSLALPDSGKISVSIIFGPIDGHDFKKLETALQTWLATIQLALLSSM